MKLRSPRHSGFGRVDDDRSFPFFAFFVTKFFSCFDCACVLAVFFNDFQKKKSCVSVGTIIFRHEFCTLTENKILNLTTLI